jgi:hypothetical protein
LRGNIIIDINGKTNQAGHGARGGKKMLSLWLSNPGEDFKIEKYNDNMLIVTADRAEFNLREIAKDVLPVVGKNNDTVYVVFKGRRLAFPKKQALKIYGNILGPTKEPPQIMTAPENCSRSCCKCKGCWR